MPINSIIDPSAAAGAYASSSRIPTAGIANKGDDGVKFSEFLKEKASESLDTMKAGEIMSAKAITGQAELTDVVQAVTAAEVTLQTIVSLRDRMISAYQEIMRMPI
jgi:flagellar hook-basal body complex protein FliE